MDTQADRFELADRDLVKEILGFGFLIKGPTPATVVENTVPDLQVLANVLLGYDQTGRRLSNLRSGYQGGFDKGLPPTLLDLSVDEVAASTAVGAPGNEKTLAIFVEFTRNPSDPRTDGNGASVNFLQDESVKFNVVQSAEAPVGTSVPPPLRADQLLLADVTLIFGQTTILNADIDQTRREAFTLDLPHGASHTESAADPIPNATPGEGGLFSATDKTKLDGVTFTDAGVAALFNNQAKRFQPGNFNAPAATSLDVTGLMVGQNPGGSSSVEGVVTAAPNNRVEIRDLDFDEVVDDQGNKVYGRITEAAAVWTLSFFSIREAGAGETAYDFTPFSGTDFQWFVQKTFALNNLPTFEDAFSFPSDQVAGEVPDGAEGVKGKVEFAPDGNADALKAVQGNDSRLGSLQDVEDSGASTGGGPYTVINFAGGITAVDAGGGKVDVSVPAATPPEVVQTKGAQTNSVVGSGASNANYDDTIPQFSEGTLVLSATITPTSLANFIEVDFSAFAGTNGNTSIPIVHLHRDSAANAIAASCSHAGETNASKLLGLKARFAVPSLSAQTYQIVVGSTGLAHFINGDGGGARRFGGVAPATLFVREVTP